jgi:tRNA-splicing ligase RtcB
MARSNPDDLVSLIDGGSLESALITYEIIESGAAPIYAWVKGVPFEQSARLQLIRTAQLPIIFKNIVVLPDVHYGVGCCVGTVIGTNNAICPSMVGLDIGCGMIATKISLKLNELQKNAAQLIYNHTSKAFPVGVGTGWEKVPKYVHKAWENLEPDFEKVFRRHGKASLAPCEAQLGTLGSGNHFESCCVDEEDYLWIVIHSGSRGVGNKLGQHFVNLARQDMLGKRLPDPNLAYFEEGTEHFDQYYTSMTWAQEYARVNREMMMRATLEAIKKSGLPRFETMETIACHHNYCQKETHFGQEVYVTRKGAVSARLGEMGIIPSSMSGVVYIVSGKGNPDSFNSCSHGAGRVMNRGDAKRSITLEQHKAAVGSVICRTDKDVIDESPAAYKDIGAVMAAQMDLINVVHTLQEIANIKG